MTHFSFEPIFFTPEPYFSLAPVARYIGEGFTYWLNYGSCCCCGLCVCVCTHVQVRSDMTAKDVSEFEAQEHQGVER